MQNSNLPKISIVTCSYNQGAFLEQCIDSVLSQGYPNLEYIVMDGGSTDHSVEIIKKYAKFFTHWQSQPDGGHWVALNGALKRTSGEIMGFLNSDDMLHPKGLHVVGNVFATLHDVSWITGRRLGFDERGRQRSYNYEHQRWSRKLFLDGKNFSEPSLYVMQEATYWRRSLWERAGGCLDLKNRWAFDFELWARFFRYAQLYSVDGLIGGFRSHSIDQHSDKHRVAYIKECLDVIEREKGITSDRPELDAVFPPTIEHPLTQPRKRPASRNNFQPKVPHYSTPADARFPKFSIVTPSFNQGEFLEETIDSVLSQNWPNLEYIVMDGGSTDNSVEIIKKYERYLSYWQSKPDGGHAAAIEDGFKRSSGEIMAWINSDDKYHPNAFNVVAIVFQQTPQCEWLTGRQNCFTPSGELSWISYCLPHYTRELYLRKLFTDPYIQQESVFFKRSLWERSGGYIERKWKLAFDLELWRRFYRSAQLFTVNELLGGFRFQPDQASQVFRNRYEKESYEILEEEYQLFLSGKFTDIPPAPEPIVRLG